MINLEEIFNSLEEMVDERIGVYAEIRTAMDAMNSDFTDKSLTELIQMLDRSILDQFNLYSRLSSRSNRNLPTHMITFRNCKPVLGDDIYV